MDSNSDPCFRCRWLDNIKQLTTGLTTASDTIENAVSNISSIVALVSVAAGMFIEFHRSGQVQYHNVMYVFIFI
jgi:hypothetical protein